MARLMGQDGEQVAQDTKDNPQDATQDRQEAIFAGCPQRFHHIWGPKGGPKMTQDDPKMAQDGPRMAPREIQNKPKRGQAGPRKTKQNKSKF